MLISPLLSLHPVLLPRLKLRNLLHFPSLLLPLLSLPYLPLSLPMLDHNLMQQLRRLCVRPRKYN
jgi:hypothetical protein